MKKTKKMITTIALILTITFAATITTIPLIQAADIPTWIYLSVAPNPVGVEQIVFINAFLSKPTPTAWMGGTGDRYEEITIEMTGPDEGKTIFGPYTSDAVGGIWDEFTPTEIGSYSFQAFYPGQQLEDADFYMEPSVSAVVTLEVQTDPILPYSSPPLPTEYWSRPIYATNHAWAQLGGSWFGLGTPSFADAGGYDATGNVNLYTTAPNTAHIVWTKPTAFGGQVGAPYNADQDTQYTSTSILNRHWEPIIINGILYYTQYPNVGGVRPGWVAVDIRTGETIWTKETDELLRMGQVLSFHSIQEYGSFPLLWSMSSSGSLYFGLYDPLTGINIANITNASPISGFLSRTGSFLMDFDCNEQGTILDWYTSGGNLTMWNSTHAIAYPNGFTGSVSYNFRPRGNIDFAAGISWSVPLPTSIGNEPIGGMSIAAETLDVILVRSAPTITRQVSRGFDIEAGYDAKTGALLWGPLNRTLPAYQDISIVAASDGYYVKHNKDSNEAWGYSLETGQQLWGPIELPGNAWSIMSRDGAIAYGNVYIWDFGGYVNALNLETGTIEWTYQRESAGYDTPYGVYPMWQFGSESICDGKLFISEGSMYTPPLFPGAQRLAINCTDGTLVWSTLSFSGRMTAAHADGYMLQWNSYDNQIYTFGKGQTATTVSIQNDVTKYGNSVLVKGMVTDESPGTKDADRTARFPNGVPAIADKDMSAWMEYVYMQQPMPAYAEGVPVKIQIIDPNNEYAWIDTVTTDSKGNYAYSFIPQLEGQYMVIATFDGSESYWGSETATYMTVDPATASYPGYQGPTATEVAQNVLNNLPDSPTADNIAQEVLNQLPDYPEMPEAQEYTTIDIIIIAAVAVVAALVVYITYTVKKLK